MKFWQAQRLKLKNTLANALDFRSRVWVVRVSQSRLKDESFIINEDSFQEPLQWMKRRTYTEPMLAQVEKMQRSQVQVFILGDQTHRLLRVK